GNGEFDSSDNLLSTLSQPGLSALGTATITATITGTLQFRDNLIYAFVDSGRVIEESNETNNYGNNAPACEFHPPQGPISPVLKWAWTGSTILPEYNQVMMTPAVADLNGDGIPDVIFNTFTGSSSDGGYLRAVSGKDGSELFTVSNSA